MTAHGFVERTSYFGIYYYFFFSFHSLPAPPPLDIRRRFGCFIYFVPGRVARSGCPARRDIKHGVKATFSLFLNGWIMQTTKKENFET